MSQAPNPSIERTSSSGLHPLAAAAHDKRQVPVSTAGPSVRALECWASFAATAGAPGAVNLYEAFHFGDSEALANELAELVLAGTKRATASLAWAYEAKGRSAPRTGSLSIVQSWSGEPLCIIETISADVVPFEEVDAEFAAAEGEGDGSLGHWREEHWAFFGRECLRLGKERSVDMPVVCESFKVIHRAHAETSPFHRAEVAWAAANVKR